MTTGFSLESSGTTLDIGREVANGSLRAGAPSRRKRRLAAALVLAIAALLAGAALRIAATRSGRGTPLALGSALPPVSLTDDAGRQVNLPDVARGRRRVVVFYSPTCGRCERDLPAIQPFPPGLDVVAISEDGDPRPSLFSSSDGPQWHLLDPRGSFRQMLPTAGLPTVLLVDGKGVLRDASIGVRAPSGFRARMQKFGEGAP